MRAFIALALPPEVEEALHRLQDALPLGRATDPDQLHLTLAFLGERPEAEVLAAHEALDGLRAPAFEMQLWGWAPSTTPSGRGSCAMLRP
jgi:2'-5' RNA ligase